MKTKKQYERDVTLILGKGKTINNIIFRSKKMSYFDIVFMLSLLKPTKEDMIGLNFWKKKNHNDYGWSAEQIYSMAENPVLTGGGDGLQQLVFGCIAALEVYTVEEILTVLDAQKNYHDAE